MSVVDTLLSPRFDAARKASYLALDVDTEAAALQLVEQFTPVVDGYKVGLELFHAAGMGLVEKLLQRNLRVFLDMKLHDIPNTVAGALRAICEYPIEMVNVHAQGGLRMLTAARAAVAQASYQPLLIGVTLLTSLDETDLADLGVQGTPVQGVERLTKLCQTAQLDGVVCSAQELAHLATYVPAGFERVVPGTRLATDDTHDQQRILTPREAMRRGATRLVLGRGVRTADDPWQALHAYWTEMTDRHE